MQVWLQYIGPSAGVRTHLHQRTAAPHTNQRLQWAQDLLGAACCFHVLHCIEQPLIEYMLYLLGYDKAGAGAVSCRSAAWHAAAAVASVLLLLLLRLLLRLLLPTPQCESSAQ